MNRTTLILNSAAGHAAAPGMPNESMNSQEWKRVGTIERMMRMGNQGLRALERKIDELGLRQQVEEELSQILIEQKIAQLRKRRGLTQAALARRSGVSQPMIAQIESGKLGNLTLKTLARTARALGAKLKVELVPDRATATRPRSRTART